MSFDELKSAWQSPNHATELVIAPDALLDPDVVLAVVQREQRQLESTVFWRDMREIVVCLLLAFLFLYLALSADTWTAYVLPIVCFGVAGFLFWDRRKQHILRPTPDAPAVLYVRASLDQVNHQIWLLKNVHWWYLLPLGIGIVANVGDVVWQKSLNGPNTIIGLGVFGLVFTIVGLIFWGIYGLNQLAVKKNLIPRRDELETLLNSLER